MATRYTEKVSTGAETRAKNFIIQCALGFASFGADEATLKPQTVDSSYYSRVSSLKKEIADLEAAGDQELRVVASVALEQQVREDIRLRNLQSDMKKRYERMIGKIEAWAPPTEDHEPFKEFMLKQLQSSLERDCKAPVANSDEAESHSFQKPDKEEAEAYRQKKLSQLQVTLGYAEEALAEQEETVAKANRWMQHLLASVDLIEG